MAIIAPTVIVGANAKRTVHRTNAGTDGTTDNATDGAERTIASVVTAFRATNEALRFSDDRHRDHQRQRGENGCTTYHSVLPM